MPAHWDSDFRQGKDTLLEEVKKILLYPKRLGPDDGLLTGSKHYIERVLPRECPVRLVVEPGVPVRVIRPFPKEHGMQLFVYTRDEHPPAHFHLNLPPGRPFGRFSGLR